MLRDCIAVAATAVVVTLIAATGVDAASPYETALAACRANAANAGDDLAGFKCDWRRLVRGAPGAALTGKFMARDKYFTGALTIIEGGDGPALVNIATDFKSTHRQCSVKAAGKRAGDDALVVTSTEEPKCSVRIVSSGRNRVQVTATDCQNLCGMGATFEGQYVLQTKR